MKIPDFETIMDCFMLSLMVWFQIFIFIVVLLFGRLAFGEDGPPFIGCYKEHASPEECSTRPLRYFSLTPRKNVEWYGSVIGELSSRYVQLEKILENDSTLYGRNKALTRDIKRLRKSLRECRK